MPLYKASQDKFICIYIFEPSVSNNYDFDIRHWRFIYQSLLDIKKQGLTVHLFYGEAIEVFESLKEYFGNISVYSHQETGNALTYKRDIELKKYFHVNKVHWYEFQSNLVIRGINNRNTWDARWIKEVKKEIVPAPSNSQLQSTDQGFDIDKLKDMFPMPSELMENLTLVNSNMDHGGESYAQKMLNDFLTEKIEKYWGSISYPEKSRYYCSMLSPYITYGNISIRQIYQACEQYKHQVRNKVSLEQYMARLKWHCHFVQKLESEPRIEFENLNPTFNAVRNKKDKKFIKAWKEGQTGYPLIDAAMRCVKETGYLNFRLRSTVVSFLTHLLWQPWQAGTGHLARMFLDYEPGIHFSQFQMQAGTTGINMIRIYNPIKQSKEKDKHGVFIKKWVPELKDLPVEYLHEPWKMTEMEQLMHNFRLGENYPKPIVDFDKSYKFAQQKLWELKNSDSNKFNSQRIIKRHARKNRKRV